ncbi:MAG: hypothetical protein CME62_05205 [Halobacteriovoraceae bacterium]|nr:hypothetical protein [Halobacteriovoraceae bacterium]|tara:strand:- start:13043 stop:13708 length:666 start_codon:yes stop_codon:yes gene_type:complete
MKVALVGSGRTGSKVAELHQDTVCFDQNNKPTLESLQACDVIICFLPGHVFTEYIDMFIASKKPCVIGSTGFVWNRTLLTQLEEKKLKWVNSHNFSLGMNLVKAMIEIMGKADKLFPGAEFSIHDIHHQHKVDSPSGTALSWKQWLDKPAKITAERTGEVIGYHHIEMKSDVEKIKITHEALDRGIFAKGALWSAERLLSDKDIAYGLTQFNNLVKKHLHV